MDEDTTREAEQDHNYEADQDMWNAVIRKALSDSCLPCFRYGWGLDSKPIKEQYQDNRGELIRRVEQFGPKASFIWTTMGGAGDYCCPHQDARDWFFYNSDDFKKVATLAGWDPFSLRTKAMDIINEVLFYEARLKAEYDLMVAAKLRYNTLKKIYPEELGDDKQGL